MKHFVEWVSLLHRGIKNLHWSIMQAGKEKHTGTGRKQRLYMKKITSINLALSSKLLENI